jgi:hypothetical protein
MREFEDLERNWQDMVIFYLFYFLNPGLNIEKKSYKSEIL